MTPITPLNPTRPLSCRNRSVLIGGEPLIVGILNVTPDSFFDGGKFTASDAALQHAAQMVADGAAMIDVGGQSTRPGHVEVSVAEEIARVVPMIGALAATVAVPISIDTYKPEVARAALGAGAHVLNDVHGLQRNPELADLAAEFSTPVIVMHNDPDFRDAPGDTIAKMKAFFERSIEIAARAGIPSEALILDPGIGFAKTQAQNVEILGRLTELRALGYPLFLGASRKSIISHVLALAPDERLEGTLAITALAIWQRVDLIRVHDVRANVRAAKISHAIRQASPS